MGRQQKLKKDRRKMRLLKKLLIEQRAALAKPQEQQNPPDLGVFVEETVKTTDKFG